MTKERLDILLVSRALAASREKARAVIMAGQVYVDGQKEDKAGSMFREDCAIEVRGTPLPYVSRGGLKLEKALKVFPVSPAGKICLDIGASTGGFTDCMLQNGAARVYAVDVGRGQLDWSLRQDPRVVCMEKTNIRYMKEGDLPEKAAFFTADVSFISLTKVLPAAAALTEAEAEGVVLIKPQFEAGRDKVGKKGVVRDPKVHEEVIGSVTAFARAAGYQVKGLDYSPIRGPEGNIEYLLWLERGGKMGAEAETILTRAAGETEAEPLPTRAAGEAEAETVLPRVTAGTGNENRQTDIDIKAVVERAHKALDRQAAEL